MDDGHDLLIKIAYEEGYESGYRAACYGMNDYLMKRLTEHIPKENEDG